MARVLHHVGPKAKQTNPQIARSTREQVRQLSLPNGDGWPSPKAALWRLRGHRCRIVRNVTNVSPYFEAPDQNGTVPESPPSMLPDVGAGQTPQLRLALHQLLLSAPGQLGSAYRALAERPNARPTELLPYADVANVGALSNRLAIIKAVTDGQYPGGPSTALQAARSVRNLLKQTTDPDVGAHLAKVAEELQLRAEDPVESQAETKALETKSKALEQQAASTLKMASGVYVYTYPHYFRHPFEPDTDRRLLKVGRTEQGAWKRVLNQARSTGAPETPLLLRVYVADSASDAERAFHKLLVAAQHSRSNGSGAGREWFSTTLEFLDVIAEILKLEIHAIDLEHG